VGTISVHYEYLLLGLTHKFSKRNQFAVGRPRRRTTHAARVGELNVMGAVGIRDVDCPLAAGTLHRKGEPLSIWRPGWRKGVAEQQPQFPSTVRR
jgi:hypothetical protein